MTAVVVRPDLSTRTALSKSALVGFDLCATKAGFELHERRKMIPSEKVSFGSALDAAIEILIVGEQQGFSTDQTAMGVATAIDEIAERDGMTLPVDELLAAVRGFRAEVMPNHRWQSARLQVSLWATITGLGEVNGHPDILMPGAVWDVKSSARQKDMPSLELGLYAILVEAAEQEPIDEVGYFTWVRSGRGRWVTQRMAVDDEYRRWAWVNARRYATAIEKDAFLGGPKFAGLCGDCQYAPWNDNGPCQIAFVGGTEE